MAFTSFVHWAKAFVSGGMFHGALESPREGATLSDTLVISGWTFSRTSSVERIEAFLDSNPLGRPQSVIDRPDVARAFPGRDVRPSGYALAVPLPPSLSGRHTVIVRVTDRLGNVAEYRCAINIDAEPNVAGAANASPAPPAKVTTEGLRKLEWVVEDFRAAHGRSPAILNWDAGVETARSLAPLAFSPLSDGHAGLPYIDRSIDIVALGPRDPDHVTEASRIASSSVVIVDRERLAVAWAASASATARRTVSIIIPVHGQMAHTEACLRQLQATLSPQFTGEIIVVDDASGDRTGEMLGEFSAGEPRLRVLRNERNVGFLNSCNRAAGAATGDVLVFLNNDTLPQPGWLEPLLHLLRDPRVGAVGSKLLYPDGRLQEAGGVTFSNATGWNFGKGHHQPSAPLFNFVREVDYCSGAALATPRSLFIEVGGFDARFAPAYYEDTDYCFTLRARGYRVLYQPASVIVHAEGATCGVDERSGVKSSQAANRLIFIEKWNDELRHHGEPPHLFDRPALHRHVVRSGGGRRALVWAPRVPEHDRESGSRRVFDTIRFLREAGWAVTFIAESATGGEHYMEALRQLGVAAYAGKETQGAGAEFLPDPRQLLALGQFDVAILHFWWLAERYLPVIRASSPGTRVIVDSVDLEFMRRARSRYQTRSNGDDVLDQGDGAAMTRELNVYASADAVLTVSAKEAAFINDLFADGGRAHVVPDAEDLPASSVSFNDRRGLLFLANFRHPPNVDALSYLTRDIVPRLNRALLERHPVWVVGNDLNGALIEQCASHGSAFRPIGWVPSVEPYLDRARITLVPLRNGAGTKRKLIQAAMSGTPSVSTSFGVEGLPLQHDRHLLVADDPQTFADEVERLLEDETLWQRLARAGREAALAAHGRDVVRARFSAVLDRLAGS